MWQRFLDFIAGGCWHEWVYHLEVGLFQQHYRKCSRCGAKEIQLDTWDMEWVEADEDEEEDFDMAEENKKLCSKLNALAAAKVMGWEWTNASHFYGERGAWRDQNRKPHSSLLWNPSANIADAWRLKQAMYEKGFLVEINAAHGKASLFVRFVAAPSSSDTRWSVDDDGNDAMAITKAALRAVGVTEEEMS